MTDKIISEIFKVFVGSTFIFFILALILTIRINLEKEESINFSKNEIKRIFYIALIGGLLLTLIGLYLTLRPMG